MTDVVYLAWRYLTYHKVKTAVLVAAVAIIVYLPIGLDIIVNQSRRELTARAQTTPLLVGAKGSPLELVLNSLYFESDTPARIPYAEVDRVDQSNLARAIPIYTRFHAATSPIVGTTLEYFGFRGLDLAEGRQMAMMGECVLGATAKTATGVGLGGSVLSSPESVFDLAGVYPLKMKVVGVLEPTGTPDDLAVFVDLKTTWVIEGLAHGHRDLTRPEAAGAVLRREGNKVIGNASVVQFNEITPDNVASFHFHGDLDTFPVTSVIALPEDKKSSDLLRGHYLGDSEQVQIVAPATVMDDLLATIFTVRGYVMVAMLIVGVATFATIALVFVLSLQLRRREMETITKIGGAKMRIRGLVAMEILGVLGGGASLAAALSVLTHWFAPTFTRMLVLLSSG
jgi:putative ABC transport system permease protein